MYVCMHATIVRFLVGLGCRSLLGGAVLHKGRRFLAGNHATCVLLQNLRTEHFVEYKSDVRMCMYVCMYVCVCTGIPLQLSLSEDISIC